MSQSAEVFSNEPEQYEGPLMSGALEQVFSLNTAAALGLMLVLLVLLVAELTTGPARKDDVPGHMAVVVLGGLSAATLLASIYGLWLFHTGSLEAGVPTLETNHPETWIAVQFSLVASTIAVMLTVMMTFARRGAELVAVLSHSAPTFGLVVAAVISSLLPHAHREIAALIVGVMFVIVTVNTINVLRQAHEPEPQLAA